MQNEKEPSIPRVLGTGLAALKRWKSLLRPHEWNKHTRYLLQAPADGTAGLELPSGASGCLNKQVKIKLHFALPAVSTDLFGNWESSGKTAPKYSRVPARLNSLFHQ